MSLEARGNKNFSYVTSANKTLGSITLQTPTGVTVYHTLDGNYLPIDNDSITLNPNTGRIQANAAVGSVAWGAITGTLSNQTDLNAQLTSIASTASNAANDASSALNAATNAYNSAQAALNAANDAANDAANKSVVSGTNDGTNWTSITIDGVNKAIPAGGSGGSAAWGQITGTLSDQTDLQNALNAITASASNAANDAANASSAAASAYNAANSAASDAANAASVAQSALNAANSKSVVTGTNDGTNWTYIAIDGVNKAIPAGGGGGGGSVDIDNQTIITDPLTGKIKTAIGGYTSTPEVTIANANTSIGGYYLRATNADLYTMMNGLFAGQTAYITIAITIHNDTENIDYPQVINATLPYTGDAGTPWRQYNAFTIQLGASNTQTVGCWVESSGRLTMFGGGSTFNDKSIVGDVVVAAAGSAIVYNKLDGRFLPIDNSSVTLNSVNQLQVAYSNGDKYKNRGYQQLFGYITNGAKDIQLTVILPKSLANINSVTVNKISIITRGVGGYVGATTYTDYAADSSYTVSAVISSDNAVSITITGTAA